MSYSFVQLDALLAKRDAIQSQLRKVNQEIHLHLDELRHQSADDTMALVRDYANGIQELPEGWTWTEAKKPLQGRAIRNDVP
jgi:hypothetical protein